MTLTPDQRLLVWHHLDGWLLAQIIVDPDGGLAVVRERMGGRAWPDGAHPELPYNRTQTVKRGIEGRSGETVMTAVSYSEIRRWAAAVPDAARSEIRVELLAAAAERNRTTGWCRCPYADRAPNEFTGPCTRYHPSDTEERQHWDVLDELDCRRDDMVLAQLGLAEDAPVQLDLFEVAS